MSLNLSCGTIKIEEIRTSENQRRRLIDLLKQKGFTSKALECEIFHGEKVINGMPISDDDIDHMIGYITGQEKNGRYLDEAVLILSILMVKHGYAKDIDDATLVVINL